MKEIDSIARLAELFQVAPSALRYWDEQHLIRFERDPENNYRYPTFQTMMDICEAVLYRSCSIPIKEIRSLSGLDIDGWRKVLSSNEQKLEAQIAQLRASIEKIQSKERMLTRLETLKSAPFSIERRALPAIQPFAFDDGDAVHTFLYDAYRSAILLNPDSAQPPEYGLFTDDEAVPLLRERDNSEALYLKGLLRVDADCDHIRNDAAFAAQATQEGYRPGELIGRYLISVCEGKRYDFYEAWMRLL